MIFTLQIKEIQQVLETVTETQYLSTPSVSPSNIILDFDEKIGTDEISEGVLTTSVLGAHTANPISGDFSVEASNAFKIENGEISYPINKAMISGSIFEIMKKCEGVKSEIKHIRTVYPSKNLSPQLKICWTTLNFF